MTRETKFTKIMAWLLCAVMIIGMIPNVSLAASAAINDWEGDIDVAETTEPPTTQPPAGSEANPITLTAQESVVTINPGETVYYQGRFSEMLLNVYGPEGFTVSYNGESYVDWWGSIDPVLVSSGSPRIPVVFSITNDSAEVAEYTVAFFYPEGSINNPATLWSGENFISFEEGSGAKYYVFEEYANGTVTFTVSGDCDWHYKINNETTYVYGDSYTSLDAEVVNSQTFDYVAGDRYVIEVVTVDSENRYTNPAGEIIINVDFVAEGSSSDTEGTEESPISLWDTENVVSVPYGETLYFQGYFNGMNMTVTGGNFDVIYNEETISGESGTITMPVSAAGFGVPVVFAIANWDENSSELSVVFTYPLGAMDNPAPAVLGDNNASLSAGSEGYYWTYIAEKDGELNISISANGGWMYVVNNMTSYIYGDTQWSDNDPVVNPTVINVTAGDEIMIMANTYDPANPWSAPAGDITINLAYTPEGPIVDENLTFYRASTAEPYASMMLGNEIKISVNVATYLYNYDEYYVEFKIDYNGGKTTTALPSSSSTEYYGNFQYAVPAPLLTETVFATVYGVKDGVVYSGETISFTVRDSIVYRLDKAYSKYSTNETAKKQFDMYIHMLKYAEEAQVRFSVNTDKLATVGVKEEYMALLKTEAPQYNTPNFGSNTSVYLYNFRLKLQEKINFYGNFLFYSGFTKIEDYSVEIEHTKSDGSIVNYSITSENGGLKWDGSYYLTFDFNAIAPSQMRDQLKITLYKNGEAITETYAATGDMATSSTNAALRDAVLNFADCAKAYFG